MLKLIVLLAAVFCANAAKAEWENQIDYTKMCLGDTDMILMVGLCEAEPLWENLGEEDTRTDCEKFQRLVHCLEVESCSGDEQCDELARVAPKDCNYNCDRSCFPATSTVELENGKTKFMDQLVIGDKVRVGPSEFSEVYFFSTLLAETTSKFVKITTESGSVSLTAGHYLYVNGGKLAQARHVRVGDVVELGNGNKAPVTEVSSMWLPGLYNPHTLHGDIIVDGIKTSTYTEAVHPTVAHALLAPLRAMYSAGVAFGEGFRSTIKGLPRWLLNAVH